MDEEYSEQYKTTIENLVKYFTKYLQYMDIVKLTLKEYRIGVDSLTGQHKMLADSAFYLWLENYNYEISYNQTCQAFFRAARELNKLEVK